MENKKIDVLFGLVVIAFLMATIIVIKDIRVMRTNDYKEYTSNLGSIVQAKNNKIRVLAARLAIMQKENEDLKNTLSETRNSLDAIGKKITNQVPTPEPAAAPAPAK